MSKPKSIPIVVHCTGDQPDLVALYELNPERYPYLLQSVAQTAGQTHFDILFAFPQQTLALDCHGQLTLSTDSSEEVAVAENSDFLTMFDHHWQAQCASGNNSLRDIPFRGGWFVFLSYELAQQIEPTLNLPKDHGSDLPVAFATRIPAAVVINRRNGEWFLVAEHAYKDQLALIKKDIESIGKVGSSTRTEPTESLIKTITEEPAEKYLSSVKRILEYIKEGDVFQVNLSRLWTAELRPEISNAGLYRRLMQTNPAPFFALANYQQHAIISSSPERLVRVSGKRIETRPIAGTRPRGDTDLLDAEKLRELIGHPKERAEHIMLIDLERNDLGRVCKTGTVKVNELMTLETYAHVHHIVSNVQGILRDDCMPGEVIRAVFPGGTITGCPKVRCMEIIAELEGRPRGAYTGSLGYINHDGSMDMNILIRTLVKNRNAITLRAGAGIVADSDPYCELEETRAKAKGLLMAL
ncbi:MAG: aminodeoxychorismate synthase component I [Gammaproteobacteria bacterium]|nr:aminodeoxychorismate synthase component I [Gammaproteobacteria bacterium]